MTEKSDQVKWLEKELRRPLHPCLSDDVMGYENRKCYQLDDDGNITGLNLALCKISDGSFLADLAQLSSLDLSGNPIGDGSFLAGLAQLSSLDLRDNLLSDASFLAGLPQLSSLNLSRNLLSDASFLAGLPQLSRLDLSRNQLSDYSFLAGLAQLSSLDLSDNLLSDGSFLAGLAQLSSLDLSRNQLSDYSFLAGLAQLTSLDLSDNEIRDGSFLAGLAQLTSLDLSDNPIGDGSFLAGLPQLSSLDLRGNQLSDGSFLAGLAQLTSLNLGNSKVQSDKGNVIADISWLPKLRNLRSINLEGNRVERIPPEVLDLRIEIESTEQYGILPQSINVYGNPLKTPPIEIVEQGHAAIVSWFQAIEAEAGEGQARRLNEVKVILVGDGGAGKTSLRKRLMDEDVDRHELQTHGIQIDDWKPEKQEVLVHFWDFGGQEIMHATHQFFLSRRSLYLLVLDGRKEEDAEYWLKHIESFGGDSHVLVVLNKMDENPGFDLNRPFLTGKYSGICDFFRISCVKKKGSGIPGLKKRLLKELRDVEMARAEWPGKWFNVKQSLEESNEDYIGFEEFKSICEDAKIQEAADQNVLVRFLSDLGVAIHFEDLRLRTTQVLNPRWVTQAVYRIINAEQLAKAGGILKLDQLDQILQPTGDDHFCYPPEKHSYIVDLMKKFELCYELDPDRVILIPDLLDVQEPEFDFPQENLLRFRFEYDFLPRSVLPRFIVRRHRDIKDQLRWRTGVVLEDTDLEATALVWADVRDRKIMIEVAGRGRRSYFALLRKTFREIHDGFQKLDVQELIPLPDHPDVAVSYEELVGHERKGWTNWRSGKLGKEFRVRDLLDGIESADERRQYRQRRGEDPEPAGPGHRHDPDFQVLLSHNSHDKPAVRELNEALKSRDISTWFDEEQIRPGTVSQDHLEHVIATCGSAAICVGENGFGPWHDAELRRLLDCAVRERQAGHVFAVIPVFLPGAPSDLELPTFLQDHAWVDLRSGFDEQGLSQLIWGITGERP